MTSFDPAAPRFHRSSPNPVAAVIAVIRRNWSIEAISLLLYLYRDAYAGAMRYYLNVVKLDVLWFIPDIAAFVCIGVFVYRYVLKERSIIATALIFYVTFSLMIGYIFLGTVAGLFSSLKMFAPVFVGFCFCQRHIKDYKFVNLSFKFLFYTSILGVFISSYIKFPWVGFMYESFGATREAGRLWWTHTDVRLSGFAADSTMAAFFIMINYVFIAVRARLPWVLIWGAIGMWGLKLTTSKTNMGVMAAFIVALLIVRLCPEHLRFRVVRAFGLYSFYAIAIPVVMVIILSGFNITDLSPSLFSLEDRINNSWQKPFIYMFQLMPTGYVTGCGIGCFNYPQTLFSPDTAKYFVPVDNFYIGTYLMLGIPFIIFMIYVIHSLRYSQDIYKLTLVFVLNIFTVTILSYGPASGLLMIGFAFSDVFARTARSRFNSGASRRVDSLRRRPSFATSGPPSLRPAE